MNFAIDIDNFTVLKNCSSVEDFSVARNFRKANDRRNRITCQWRENRLALAVTTPDREQRRVLTVIGQST